MADRHADAVIPGNRASLDLFRDFECDQGVVAGRQHRLRQPLKQACPVMLDRRGFAVPHARRAANRASVRRDQALMAKTHSK